MENQLELFEQKKEDIKENLVKLFSGLLVLNGNVSYKLMEPVGKGRWRVKRAGKTYILTEHALIAMLTSDFTDYPVLDGQIWREYPDY
jgi:hypothetical protein